ncbi:glycosyltransferase family 2 protein [Paenibacillus sp. 481]|uniref:glycosyltransferase family 2 protein n=1 Tax=Paenibacillus sp. 481 TaxID=2835869 RepID=UPI001E331118|nr:glycosyltransferase family 2 protein [Paenibacillus sp. 481]UHA74509.1 glycosyltransferase family 2 protein [Paenibacillus sp. 481]
MVAARNMVSSRKPSRRSRINHTTQQHLRLEKFNYGYARGYAEGVRAGQEQYMVPFEGTSIIIPTYNHLDLLKQCVESIQTHTSTPYEIIVVDDASEDETAHFLLNQMSHLRFHAHETNRGFAAAVNTGLMMAKGQTICVLNNDTIVTTNWLNNMLNCLNSDPDIGVVGPVTNFISGDQQIPVPYKQLKHMQEFAEAFNVPNASKWQRTDRLVGFCMLFRRELFETTGYLDEGFEIGNFEDDDYMIRIRLNGRKLMIARDSFIHHFGSMSMKQLGDRITEINDRNGSFFSAKWGNPYELVHRVRQYYEAQSKMQPTKKETVRAQSYYPTHVAVTGLSDTVYWIEHGTKYPLFGSVNIPIVKVSQIDLCGWGTGPIMDAAVAEVKWNLQSNPDGTIPDGGVFRTEKGKYYQRQGECWREIVTEHALIRWRLDTRVLVRLDRERQTLKEGLPISAAPLIVAFHL